MSHQLMAWLQVLTRLVLVQIMMAALTVLGLGLLGAAPAAAAAARVAGPIRRDEALPVVGTMWRTWRATFWRANLAAAPAAVLMAAAAGNLLLLGVGGVRVPPPAGGLLASLAALIGLAGLLVWLVSAVLSSEEELVEVDGAEAPPVETPPPLSAARVFGPTTPSTWRPCEDW